MRHPMLQDNNCTSSLMSMNASNTLPTGEIRRVEQMIMKRHMNNPLLKKGFSLRTPSLKELKQVATEVRGTAPAASQKAEYEIVYVTAKKLRKLLPDVRIMVGDHNRCVYFWLASASRKIFIDLVSIPIRVGKTTDPEYGEYQGKDARLDLKDERSRPDRMFAPETADSMYSDGEFHRDLIDRVAELVSSAGAQAVQMMRAAKAIHGGIEVMTPTELLLLDVSRLLGSVSEAHGGVQSGVARLYHGIQTRLDATSRLRVDDCTSILDDNPC